MASTEAELSLKKEDVDSVPQDKNDEASEKSADDDEEEQFMSKLEHDEEEKEEEERKKHPEATTVAPTLIRSEVAKQEQAGDSKAQSDSKTATTKDAGGEEKKGDEMEEQEQKDESVDVQEIKKQRVSLILRTCYFKFCRNYICIVVICLLKQLSHCFIFSKASQLDFLLSRASEYSNFISADLKELQDSMSKQAEAALAEPASNSTKKRKRGGNTKANKKRKNDEAEAALARAQEKHSNTEKPIFIQPANLANGCKLKNYQLEGVRWLASLYENGVSGILADEMGLGKTIQVISLIAYLRTMKVNGPFLIVAPLATLPNWIREFQKWLPEQPVERYHGNKQERDKLLRGPLNYKYKRSPNFPVIVTSFEVAIRDSNRLDKIGEFTYLVVDEGQRLKNHRCLLIKSLKKIQASNRLLLSGTPIQNNLDELWSLLNFVNPQIFDDLSVFQSWFGFRDIGQKGTYATSEDQIMEEQRKNQTVTKLHEILRPFLLRRLKRDVLIDMPPKKEIVVYAGMSKLQSGYAQLIDNNTIRETLEKQGIDSGKNLSQTNKIMNHRKNSNHPFLFGEPIDPANGQHVGTSHPLLLIRASGKFALLDRMLNYLHKNKHQVLIFSQMTAVLNIMEDYLIYKNWKYCRIDGSTKIDDRQAAMDAFNAEKTNGVNGTRNDSDDRMFVFLLSTRAGGLGINLVSGVEPRIF